MKEPVAALFKGFLDLKEMVSVGEVHQQLYATQGLEALRKLNEEALK